MPVKFVDKVKVGFRVIVEARKGFLLGGRAISDNVVCDTFFEALAYMTAVIEANVNTDRSVRVGKVLEFRGMVSTPILVPDRMRR
jgi:hypothetical protein